MGFIFSSVCILLFPIHVKGFEREIVKSLASWRENLYVCTGFNICQGWQRLSLKNLFGPSLIFFSNFPPSSSIFFLFVLSIYLGNQLYHDQTFLYGPKLPNDFFIFQVRLQIKDVLHFAILSRLFNNNLILKMILLFGNQRGGKIFPLSLLAIDLALVFVS